MRPDLVIAAIIPARCGSKRVRLKNIQPLGGKPLLAHTVEAAIASGAVGTVCVSTDCEEIAAAALAAGAEVIERPAALAGDQASSEAVVLHGLDILRQAGLEPDWVLTLPPTSPFRGPEVIRRAVALAGEVPGDVDAIFTVHEHRGDFWRGDPATGLQRLFPDAPRRQQDREPLWEENSALYATRPAALRATGFILGRRHVAMPISPLEGTDINTALDLRMARALLETDPGDA